MPTHFTPDIDKNLALYAKKESSWSKQRTVESLCGYFQAVAE